VIAQTSDDLDEFYDLNPELCGRTLWQEIIEGGDDSVLQCNVLVTAKGLMEATVCIRKIHQYPPGFGSMSFGRTERVEFIVAESARILEALEYRGLASLEFKVCPTDGRYYFIEMNPRLPWYNSLFADAGVNLAYLAFRDLTQEADPGGIPPEQHDGVYWLAFADELRRFIEVRGKSTVTLAGWLKMILQSRSFAWWCATDPMPFLRAFIEMLSAIWRRLWRRSKSLIVPGRGGF
jgi:predicted ATP-grasp superfamily ATP-dependent carboligase